MMQPAPIPSNDLQRLASLHALQILDTSAEERFDRITRLAKRFFSMPMAVVSLVDAQRQWFKSAQGMAVCETARDISFCGHAIMARDLFIIPDTWKDPRFADNPLVTGDPWLRFYAGCPLMSLDGYALGSFCLLDRAPRTLSATEQEALRDFGAWVEHELHATAISEALLLREQENQRQQEELAYGEALKQEHQHLQQEHEMLTHAHVLLEALSTRDSLTGVCNRRTILSHVEKEVVRSQEAGTSCAILFVDIDHFKRINDTYGHSVGDQVLQEAGRRLGNSVRAGDHVGRYGGEEFVLVLANTDPLAVAGVAERLRLALAQTPVPCEGTPGPLLLTCSIGVAVSGIHGTTREQLIEAADQAMYQAKREGRNQVRLARRAIPHGRAVFANLDGQRGEGVCCN